MSSTPHPLPPLRSPVISLIPCYTLPNKRRNIYNLKWYPENYCYVQFVRDSTISYPQNFNTMSSYPCTKCPIAVRNSTTQFPHPRTPTSRNKKASYPFSKTKSLISQISISSSCSSFSHRSKADTLNQCLAETRTYNAIPEDKYPTMSEIMEASRAQNLDLQLQKLWPFF